MHSMLRVGIICPSEIALRRFLPALKKISSFEYVGVAIASKSEWVAASDELIANETEKANVFLTEYGGKIFESYRNLVESNEIDVVYLPLPPALHFEWAKLALLNGKHIIIEKPATTNIEDTDELISIAKAKNLAIHENYMFAFHDQIQEINNLIQSKKLGDVRLFRISFGFPRRDINDFRYNKKLGGGALLDCGGYTIKYASMLLGETSRIVHAQINYINEFNVDIYGSGVITNNSGDIAQISFGMDNSYKCDLEVWGSLGSLTSGRVLTAPEQYIPEVTIKIGNDVEIRKLSSDDAFLKSIRRFYDCILNDDIRLENYNIIRQQALLVSDFYKKSI